jgi:hypothetical protein
MIRHEEELAGAPEIQDERLKAIIVKVIDSLEDDVGTGDDGPMLAYGMLSLVAMRTVLAMRDAGLLVRDELGNEIGEFPPF